MKWEIENTDLLKRQLIENQRTKKGEMKQKTCEIIITSVDKRSHDAWWKEPPGKWIPFNGCETVTFWSLTIDKEWHTT